MSTIELLGTHSHRRRNALTGRWTLVSPHRLSRPWLGQHDAAAPRPASFDPQCYLCPGNARAGGERNPAYTGTFVFDNDYPALSPVATGAAADDPLLAAEALGGRCRVVCYSPRHDLSLGELPAPALQEVIATWRSQWLELNADPRLRYTQIFENRGSMMGASNPHPHGQIWSTGVEPDEIALERAEQQRYFSQHGRALLDDYAEREQGLGERLVLRVGVWCALVPFWAVWPFELLVLPLTPLSGFEELTGNVAAELAELLSQTVRGYDAVFGVPFPYSMGWHPRPREPGAERAWRLHAHFYPPLLRSAIVRKFQTGFEMLGMPQRDITPEAAAAQLRESCRRAGCAGVVGSS